MPRRPEYLPSCIDDPIRIFDTGEQAPGASMTSAEKLAVDVIDAGFPASSPDDLDAVRSIAAGEDGHVPALATSKIHMVHKPRKTPEQMVAAAREMVAYVRSLELAAEDTTRSNRGFLYHILKEITKAGAIDPPTDIVRYTLLREYHNLIADKANTPGFETAIISAHCHNDLGLATANTLAAACAGARQLEVTINGIAERAGSASLEEVVMAIKCRQELLGGIYAGINSQHITTTSKMVQEHSGLHIQPHKAIVGANAFAHESGIHQDGMLKYKGTYEMILPDDIALTQANEFGIVLGKLSGRHAVRSKLVELGYEISDNEFEDFYRRYKEFAGKKKRVTDEDIEALLTDEIFQHKVIWSLGDIQATCGTLGLSTATVKLIAPDGEEKIACSVGTGPVDVSCKATNQIVQIPTVLQEYSMTPVTEGIDAIATTRLVITGDVSNNTKHALNGHSFVRAFSGSGADTDTVASSV
ncbi:hypothetical protein ACP70R_041218 [Stipagrostis hirtigluma subsp. patula]